MFPGFIEFYPKILRAVLSFYCFPMPCIFEIELARTGFSKDHLVAIYIWQQECTRLEGTLLYNLKHRAMKTLTLHLESHDDVASTIDKISWGKARRFVLVWPKHNRLMRSRLDLVLIQRHCTRLGAQLGIITQDADVEEDAKQLGIPVFSLCWPGEPLPLAAETNQTSKLFQAFRQDFQKK